jgi:TonB family protein
VRSDRLAIAALALGLLGLFTAGGLCFGSLLGLVLAGVALTRKSQGARRDVAWAAVAANVCALLTLLPVGAAIVLYRADPSRFVEDDSLPEPAHAPGFESPDFSALPPPPPPPPSPPAREAPARRAQSGAVPKDAAPVRIGGTIPEPRKTRNVHPVYPSLAVQARVQGAVVLECTISPEGKVVRVKTVRGVTLLTEAAVEAVRQWEYTPTLVGGVPVPVIMTVTVTFKLS